LSSWKSVHSLCLSSHRHSQDVSQELPLPYTLLIIFWREVSLLPATVKCISYAFFVLVLYHVFLLHNVLPSFSRTVIIYKKPMHSIFVFITSQIPFLVIPFVVSTLMTVEKMTTITKQTIQEKTNMSSSLVSWSPFLPFGY
jgi:hypothetical protein